METRQWHNQVDAEQACLGSMTLESTGASVLCQGSLHFSHNLPMAAGRPEKCELPCKLYEQMLGSLLNPHRCQAASCT